VALMLSSSAGASLFRRQRIIIEFALDPFDEHLIHFPRGFFVTLSGMSAEILYAMGSHSEKNPGDGG